MLVFVDSSKHPGWFRGLEVVFGLGAMVLGILVLAFPGVGIASLIILLALGLLFASFRSISFLGLVRLPGGLKVLGVITGILSLVLAVLVVAFPGFGAAGLVVLLSFGLFVYGVNRIVYGYMHRGVADWHRGTVFGVGILAVVLSLIVLVLPGLSLLTLAVILAVVLIFSGAEMALSGVTGVSRFTAAAASTEAKSA
jgi:uncharacterized membrane protein HdeD (DUF308 family)